MGLALLRVAGSSRGQRNTLNEVMLQKTRVAHCKDKGHNSDGEEPCAKISRDAEFGALPPFQ